MCGSETVATVLLHSTQQSKPFVLYSVFVTGLWEQSWFYTLSLDCENSHGFILCLCHWIVRTVVVLYTVIRLWEQSWFYTLSLSLDCENSHGFIRCLCHWIVRTVVVISCWGPGCQMLMVWFCCQIVWLGDCVRQSECCYSCVNMMMIVWVLLQLCEYYDDSLSVATVVCILWWQSKCCYSCVNIVMIVWVLLQLCEY